MAQTYDAGGRLLSIVGKNAGGTTLTSFSYTYTSGASDTSLRQSMTDTAGNVTTYTYDRRAQSAIACQHQRPESRGLPVHL